MILLVPRWFLQHVEHVTTHQHLLLQAQEELSGDVSGMEIPKFFPVSTFWDIGLFFSLLLSPVVSLLLRGRCGLAGGLGLLGWRGGVVACVRAIGFNFIGVHFVPHGGVRHKVCVAGKSGSCGVTC